MIKCTKNTRIDRKETEIRSYEEKYDKILILHNNIIARRKQSKIAISLKV
jgi:hypothetical protein